MTFLLKRTLEAMKTEGPSSVAKPCVDHHQASGNIDLRWTEEGLRKAPNFCMSTELDSFSRKPTSLPQGP